MLVAGTDPSPDRLQFPAFQARFVTRHRAGIEAAGGKRHPYLGDAESATVVCSCALRSYQDPSDPVR
jgi:hypothetical protein